MLDIMKLLIPDYKYSTRYEPPAGKPEPKKRVRMCQAIPASRYADWLAGQPNRPKYNQRQMKRLKNKLLKAFLKGKGIDYRVKTHDHTPESFLLWQGFHKAFRLKKQEFLAARG